jgi:RND family efflux transporter MFP subunit
MKRQIVGFLVFGIALTTLLNGCSKKEKISGEGGKQIVAVQTTPVMRRNLQEFLSFTGNVEAKHQLNVVPHISGKIARIFVKEGQFVRAGTVIAMLDTELISYQLQQAKAGLAVAKANLHNAELNWKRIQELKKNGSVSDQQFDKMRVGIEAARAQMQQARAAFDMASYQMRVAKMRAPFSGFIGQKFLHEGDIINPMMPGGFGVCTLVDISSVKISTHVSEGNFVKLKPGQLAEIRVDAYPDSVFHGEVTSIVPVADPASRSFKVNIVASNPGYLLKAGMFARLRILVARHKNVLAIPIDALHLEGSKKFAFTIDNNHVAHKILLKTGILNDRWVEVLNGLNEGESVVTIGKDILVDGQHVHLADK